MTQITTGTVVRLKSGSPKMTVRAADTAVGADVWAVQWIDRNGKLQSNSFHADMLDKFEPKPH